jgi:hypothetical protein
VGGDRQSKLRPIPTARQAVESWDRWVSELERLELLDRHEYDALLAARDDAEQLVEIVGSERLVDEVDEIDARFVEATIEAIGSPFERPGGGWWRRRMPRHPRAPAYLLGR